MFSYNYIVPTGPSGYYNYSNQQATTSALPASTQPYTPPQSHTGAAQSYYRANSTESLAQLIPAQTDVYSPRSNPRLTQIYQEYDQWINRPIPDHETRYIKTLKDFQNWMDGVYHPKMRALTELRAGLDAFQQQLYAFAEDSCRLGATAYNFLTENLEIGDVFDIMVAIETRLEDIFDALLKMDELKIDIESDTNAADCFNHKKTKYGQQWKSYKDTTKTTARRNFHRARSVRKRAHYEKFSHYVTTADSVDTPPYQAIMNAIAQISALQTDDDIVVLTRASIVLQKAVNQSVHINAIRYQAQCDMMYEDEVACPWVDAPVSQQNALLDRQRQIVDDLTAKSENHKQAVESHYMQWGKNPIARLMDTYRGVIVPQTGVSAYGSQSVAQQTAAPPAYTASTTSAAATQAPVAQSGAKMQMPLSWYSNMLTQQHVTNMQIANNVGGGSTTFHLANSSGGIIY